MFATEPLLSSLELSIPGSGRHASLVELDEVEVSTAPITTARVGNDTLCRFRKEFCNWPKACPSCIAKRDNIRPARFQSHLLAEESHTVVGTSNLSSALGSNFPSPMSIIFVEI